VVVICRAKIVKKMKKSIDLLYKSNSNFLMNQFTTKYLGKLRCENTHNQSGTIIHTDAPTDNQGNGMAFSPTDLCALSLTTCIITTMGIYAQMKEIEIVSIEADTNKIMASDPRRISRIESSIRMKIGHNATDRDKEGLERIVKSCPVSRSLHPDIEQVIMLEWV
jgi:uncharacterized OsmC-like protein